MFDFGWFVRKIKDEWSLVKSAPFFFSLCIVFGAFAAWAGTSYLYKTFIVANKDGVIALKEQEKGLLQTEIEQLLREKENSNADTSNVGTRQLLRAFLKSVNPEILQRIDSGDANIRVFMNVLNQVKLDVLYWRPDIDKFLRAEKGDKFSKGKQSDIAKFGDRFKDCIYDNVEIGELNNYDLYPEEALRER
ncbi:MAG: hypothetical protein JW806_04400 [Sedimentisphaerales bacterium]|nr:hypothetical protein [Sedimentisphaerales bacterium]